MADNFQTKTVIDLTSFSKLIEVHIEAGYALPKFILINSDCCEFFLHATKNYIDSPNFGHSHLMGEYKTVYAIPYYHKDYLSYALYGVYKEDLNATN